MCNFLSMILIPNLKVYFTESNSHETGILRLGLKDYETGSRRQFLRGEHVPGNPFELDEDEEDLPTWYTEHKNEYMDICQALFNRVYAARKVYYAKHAAAWKVYDAKDAAARKVYDAKHAAAWKVYIRSISKIDGYVPEK